LTENNIVYHNDTPEGTVFYPNNGRPCLGCKRFFMNSYDYGLHMPVCDVEERRMGWKTNRDGRKWCSSSRDPILARQIEMNGYLVMAGLKYTLSLNKRWIYCNLAP